MSKVQVDKVVNLSDDGAPQLTYGAELPVGYGLTGAGGLNISGVVTAASAVFSGNVTIGGTLTYEDVTNIDVVGVSTFAGRMNVNSTIEANEGLNVSAGIVTVNDYIQHAGDTNTNIRFPAADTITAETGGSERIRVDSSGRLLLGAGAVSLPKGSAAGSMDLDNGNITMCIGGNVNSTGRTNSTNKIARITTPHYTNTEEPTIFAVLYNISGENRVDYGGGTSQGNSATSHRFYTAADSTTTSGTERVRIDSSGRLHIGSSNNSGTNTKFVVGEGNNIDTTAIINTNDVDVDCLTLSNWDGSTTTTKIMMTFDNSGHGGFNIGMPAATDAFVIEDDGGDEALRIDSSNRLLLGTTTEGAAQADNVTVSGTGDVGMTFRSTDSGTNRLFFSDGTSGASEYAGYLNYHHTDDTMRIGTNGSTRITINSVGITSIQGSDDQDNFIVNCSGTEFAVHTDTSDGEISLRAQDQVGSTNAKYMTFFTQSSGASSAEVARFTSSGTLMVGTTAGAGNKALELYQASNAALRIQNSTTGTGAGDGLLLEAGATQAILWNYENTQMILGTNGNARVTIANDGHVVLSNSIAFNAETAAANRLDDYEEGVFTPTLGHGITAAAADGTYTKVGNLCVACLNMTFPTTSDGNHIVLGSLPFDAASGRSGAAILRYSNGSTAYKIAWHVNAGGATVSPYFSDGGAVVSYANVSAIRFDLIFVYRTT